MKKFFLIMAVVAITCMTALTSCKKSNADLIKEYESVCKELVTAAQNGDFEKIATLAEEGQKLEKELGERELTDEEQSQLLEIQASTAAEMVGGASEAPAEQVNPEEALELTVAEKNLSPIPESSMMGGSWTVNVTNNSSSAIDGDSYKVIWTETIEDTVDGEFVDKDIERSLDGQNIAPGETVTFVLKPSDGCQSFKNPQIKSAE